MRPFRIEVPEAALDDLRARLRGTRWPERETVSDWSQGVPLAHLRELCGYWAAGYDWRAADRRGGMRAIEPTLSVGVARRKALAKLASRSAKPDGLPLFDR